MNFYQLGYFRTGKQGGDAGWKLVAASEGLDYDVANGFKGIAANLVELKKTLSVPSHTLGVFQYERFVYIIHVNFAARGRDERGVTYVHGYCLSLRDYYELCREPEKLLGIREENYITEYDNSVREYPVLSELSYDRMDYDRLWEKYGFSVENYSRLMEGVICAAEGFTMPLCIRYTVDKDGYKQVYKEIMYLIMKGLPYHLRTKLTGYSHKSGGTVIYFSDTVDSNNYFDLDNKTYACDYSKIKSYKFVNAFTFPTYNNRDNLYQNMADIMNDIFKNPLYDNSLDRVEASYQRMRLKVMPADEAPKLLEYLSGCDLTENEETYVYLRTLLKTVNQSEMLMTNKEFLKSLASRYGNYEDNEFKREVCTLSARGIINGDKDEGFRFLLEIFHDFPEEYEMLCSALEIQDSNFYKEYYTEIYLPEILYDLDAVGEYLKNNKKIEIYEYNYILNITQNIAEREFGRAHNFQEMDKVGTAVEKISDYISDRLCPDKEQYISQIRYALWNNFDPNQFDSKEIEMYRHCYVDKIAGMKFNGEECRNAQRVYELVRLFEENNIGKGYDYLISVLFTDDIISGMENKERIRGRLLEIKLNECNLSEQEGFDYSLALFYNCQEEHFDTLGWVNWAESQKTGAEPELSHLRKNIMGSKILELDNVRENLKESIKIDIKRERKGLSEKQCKKQIEKLKLLQYLLEGEIEEVCANKGKVKDNTKAKFFFALHRVPIGMFAISAVGFWLICVERYMNIPLIQVRGAAIVLAIFFIFISAVKLGKGNKMKKIFIDGGRISLPYLSLYVGTFLVMAIGIAAVYFLPGIKKKMIGIFALSLISVASAITYGAKRKR